MNTDVNLRRLQAEIKHNIEILMCPLQIPVRIRFRRTDGVSSQSSGKTIYYQKNTFKNDNAFHQKLLPGHRRKFVLVFFSLSLAHLAASTLDGSCPATYTKLNHKVRNETECIGKR